jgi:hypothetical protein
MSETTGPREKPVNVDVAFEGEKWEAEKAFRDREFQLKEKEQKTRDREVDAKLIEVNRSRWNNPIALAILAAAVAAAGNIYVAY